MPLPQLTSGFIQRFVSGDSNAAEQPNLQILDFRPVSNDPNDKRFRFRLSDGQFIFNTCINQSQLSEQIEKENLNQGTPIIHLQKWNKSFVQGSRLALVVCEYKLIAKGAPKIGNPTAHSGNPGDYPPAEPFQGTSTVDGRAADQQQQKRTAQVKPEVQIHEQKPNGSAASREPTSSRSVAAPRSNSSLPTRSNPLHQNITPIKLITPFINRWKICGRVIDKNEEVQTKKSARGDFKVFNFEMADDQGSRIRVAVFNELTDKFFHVIHKDSTYYLSGAMVKKANPDFNRTGHQYELSLRSDSELMPCRDHNIAAPRTVYKFTKFSELGQKMDSVVDVLGVVYEVADVVQIQKRDSNEILNKREVQLLDETGTVVALTLWAEKALKFPFANGEYPIVAFKDLRVKEFNGINLSATPATKMEKSPDCEECFALASWFAAQGTVQPLSTLSHLTSGAATSAEEYRLIDVAELLQLGDGDEKGAYFRLVAYIGNINEEKALYKACPNETCKKKVIDTGGQWRCEKCNQTFDNYKYLFLLSVELLDLTGSHWVTLFGDQAQKLLNVSTQELGRLLNEGQMDKYCAYFNQVKFQPLEFKIRAKAETYNDERKIKWVVMDVNPLHADQYLELLDKAIAAAESV